MSRRRGHRGHRGRADEFELRRTFRSEALERHLASTRDPSDDYVIRMQSWPPFCPADPTEGELVLYERHQRRRDPILNFFAS